MNARTTTHAATRPDQKFASKNAQRDDRRRRPRLMGETVGYLLCDGVAEGSEPTEVRVQDVSRAGVGFLAGDALEPGTICRIRIGYGPMRLARRMRVARCEKRDGHRYLIGAEFA